MNTKLTRAHSSKNLEKPSKFELELIGCFRNRLSMSTGTKKEVAFIQENQNKAEHSALFYLFQEVSKLDPPVHTSFLDAHSPSRWLNEMSRKRHFSRKTEDDDEYPPKGSREYGLSCMLSCDRVKDVSEEDGDASDSDGPRCECSSPWKVLSLINLTCERLLHQKDANEENSTSESSSTKSIQSNQPPNRIEGESEGDSLDCTSAPERTASVAPVADLRPDGPGDSRQLRFCVKDAGDVQQPPEKAGPVTSEMQEDASVVSLQALCRDGEELSVSKQLNQEYNKCLSTKKDAPFPKKETKSAMKAEMTFSSGYKACVDQSKPALTLDHNANITLSTELPCDTQLPPQSAALPSSQPPLIFTTAESCQSSSGQDENFTTSAPKCRQNSTEDSYPAADRSSCDICFTASPAELWTEQTKESDPPHQHRTKSRRKQPHPSRSADIQDPDFQGVTFQIDAELDDTREQCRLLITSKYSKKLYKAVRKPKLRVRTSQKTLKTSSSDEENDLTANAIKNKVCASCCTRKTPMWRDAEDGTPLCNACGIRYKKYRVRCVNCWHIPRKEGNSNSCCLKCGHFVKRSSALQKHSS